MTMMQRGSISVVGRCLLMVSLLALRAQGVGAAETKKQGGSDLEVQLKLVTERDLASLFDPHAPGDTRPELYELYILGRVTNHGSDSAFVRLDIDSPKNPTVHVKDVRVGWIAPNGMVPAYFLIFLMQPLLKTSLQDAQDALEYRITSVTRK